jgi:hypothetical protein
VVVLVFMKSSLFSIGAAWSIERRRPSLLTSSPP